MLEKYIKYTSYILIMVMALTFSSCEEEDVLSDRELIEQELREVIITNEVNIIMTYIGENSLDEFSQSWSFRDGFLILDGTQYYDLDKLRSYEVDYRQGASQTILYLRFL